MFEEYEDDNQPTMPTPEFTIQMVKMLGISVEDIKASVIDGVKVSILESIEKDVRKQVAESIKGTVDGLVSEWVKNFMDNPYTPVNSWGEPMSKETTSIRAVIEQKAQDFMMEKVNDTGKVDNYRNETPRYLWAARQVANEAMEKTLRPELDKVIKEMRVKVQSGITSMVSDLVARNFK